MAFCQSLGTASRMAMAREDVQRFEKAFAALPEQYREVIIDARLIGLSHPEIAEKTGKSEGAVRTLLSRALSRLATLLDS